ncbi:TylF/MycF/NovP-related O-methyltransferase [Brevibacillus porteri]|uniref:Crotonobetainyl-CoA--carnitine CoA-transferase n=1 Tax=Brevibacillus porteri TaxID=2126350 RepID=A0ABX5FPI9_9BACL|nr:TylF/MycF/NovP-related O-methyltransferase [Brevibacillus porteri]MED1801469.1 TylF/MycF/NovP-related O-methyltransferase [Brevibacillus porteri]MED2133828.1 TylF/MycF/NovP-related O-methyltransferase [Brevibacillus porteri]MED2748234.1 TylF/MycF/NovP-related O-methyltransferase [Brevibacillus porteri]MED2815372.1 TylF/MycF/NovP-related O-methyltransferase [Brevibacillus porteri]MED2894821.1 TylF/MycF/NovP-related O-methyltransferase [Brevibacillus porteri]
MNKIEFLQRYAEDEKQTRLELLDLFINSPIPKNEMIDHMALYTHRQMLSHILFINDIFQQILNVNGVIMEFGVRWGTNLAIYEALRGIYEPYNYTRKIVGFDTFEGFPSVNEKDGTDSIIKKGAYAVTEGYEEYLENLLFTRQKLSPLNHINKFELVKGDATQTLKKYLEEHPETIISLAYFDFDIYEPTKACLELIMERVTKGSIIAFDELNYPAFPGETLALLEVLGINKYQIRRSKFATVPSYIIIE